jgi:pimeloyl-ACP methyl ester carboxylesterase
VRSINVVIGLLVCVAASANPAAGQQAGAEEVSRAQLPSRVPRPLTLNRTDYRFRAGERVLLEAPPETLDFIRNAKSRSVMVNGEQPKGFVIGHNVSGEVVLAASLTTPPGDYTVTISAANQTGEQRAAALTVTLSPLQTVPSSATRPPVVLLNGWQIGLLSSCPISTTTPPSFETFGSLESALRSDGVPVVYFFDNCVEDPNALIEDLGAVLGQFINLIRYDNGALVPQVDLIGHSMGGLIIRSYLAGAAANGSLAPPLNPRARKIIQIATPNFGSFMASSVPFAGPQTTEMIPGSAFLWNLATWNQWEDDLRGIDALAIIGNQGWLPLASNLANASDGVVSVSSASLGFARDPTKTRILPYCHTDSTVFIDCNGLGIATRLETQNIILSFLANTSTWQSIGTTPQQDPWLSRFGGMYAAAATATATFIGDLRSVSFGSVPLGAGGAAGSVFYDELVSGTDTFHFNSSSVGNFTYGPRTESTGYYSVYRAKFAPVVSAVGPLLPSTSGARIVQSGANITLAGVGLGATQCSTCTVTAYPGYSSPGITLPVSLWTDQAITAFLPSTFVGLSIIVVQAANSGSDSITFMAATRPQSGWWWDPNLNGIGFFIETAGVSGNGIFIGGFEYDGSGNATWVVSTGQMNGSTYNGTWLKDSGGQTLTGPYHAPVSANAGNLSITFSDPTHGVMTRPDGTRINIQRFSFTTIPSLPPEAGTSQVGWWWAGLPLQGTGYGIEFQGSSVFMVAYVFDASGNPAWYLATGTMTTPTTYTGTWDLYAGGPTLTSPE